MMHATLHPREMVRPDNITRSGIIQPFSVRAMDPVQYARAEINPFINAIRPQGAQSAPVQMDGGLGIVSPEVLRTLSQSSDGGGKTAYCLGGAVGGIALGLLAGWLLFK